jgi:LUC7 N_terminus
MSRKYRDAPKSDLDSQRDLLDSLMGVNRNNDRDEDSVNDLYDDRLCKFYLQGICPHDMFVNTKMDCGPCSKLHSDIMKDEFENKFTGDKAHVFDHIIEREFTARVYDIDRIIDVSISYDYVFF